MSNTRSKVVVFILLLGLLCFLTAPVFSGEGPWDADGTGGTGNANDTTGSSDDLIVDNYTRDGNSGDRDGGGFLVFFLKTTYRYFIFQSMDTGSYSSASKVLREPAIKTVAVNQSSSRPKR